MTGMASHRNSNLPFPELPSRRHFGHGWGVKVSVTLAAIALVLVGVIIQRTEMKKREQREAMSEYGASIYEVPVREVSDADGDTVAMGTLSRR